MINDLEGLKLNKFPNLITIYPKEYDNFLFEEKSLIENKMEGKRILKKKREWVLFDFYYMLRAKLNELQRSSLDNEINTVVSGLYNLNPNKPNSGHPSSISLSYLSLYNLNILQALGREIQKEGGE